ncbi:MAG: bifunctional serine/threonine-protein kinase/formylglycine-generating enzyme family protein [Planctomycetota bacterium]
MNRSRWERMQEVLQQALSLPAEDREAFLERECAEDEALRSEVRSMLDTPDPSFLEHPELEEAEIVERSPDLAPGTRVGDFELVRVLGRGGAGVVYLAQQRPLDRLVAVKILAQGLGPSDQRISRFAVEAIAAAKLRHANVVRVLSAGEADGCRYIAMEFIDGCDLDTALSATRRREADAPLPLFEQPVYVTRVVEIVRDVASALDYAHRNGILHRDVKPQNILLDRDGKPYVGDFGLAKDLLAETISVSGQILGTPYYMSPEQAQAKSVEVDRRSDVFSLGAVLYEALTLRRPFEGDSIHRVLASICSSEPTSVRKLNARVHRDLDTICVKALEKRRSLRFESAGQLARELQRFLDREPLTIRRTLPPVRLARKYLQYRMPMTSFLLVMLTFVGVEFTSQVSHARNTEASVLAVEKQAALAKDDEARRRVRSAAVGLKAPNLNADQLARIDALLAEIDSVAWHLAAEGDREYAGALTRRGDERDEYLDRARQLWWRASRLAPDDEDLRLGASRSLLPRVSFSSNEAGLVVSYRRVDRSTGDLLPEQDLGVTPLEPVEMPRGYYRLLARSSQGGMAEISLHVDQRAQEYSVLFQVRATQVTEGMALIGGSTCRVRDGARRERVVEVDPFWIDEAEVSIADYGEFLAETGYPPPAYWLRHSPSYFKGLLDPSAERDSEMVALWGEYPMSGVTLDEARAYAAWRGKRLPTAAEWLLAAGGPRSRGLPWKNDWHSLARWLADKLSWACGEDESFRRQHAVLRLGSTRIEKGARRHVLSAKSVRDPGYVQTAGRNGLRLFHVLGNVKEWTDTVYVSQRDGEVVPESGAFVVLGGGWDSPINLGAGPYTVDCLERKLAGAPNFSVGFRCAKSL